MYLWNFLNGGEGIQKLSIDRQVKTKLIFPIIITGRKLRRDSFLENLKG